MKCEYCNKDFKNSGALGRHRKSCEKINNIKNILIDDYLNESLSIRDLAKKYNIDKNLVAKALGSHTRTSSEANKIARKRYPQKHSEESKKKIREARLKFMKENPEKTAWRKKNMSYPEKIFKDALIKKGLDKVYLIVRERSVFPYFIDFAFENEKVAVEIDGSQHENEDVKLKDERKDEKLISEGWRVYRVTAKQVKQKLDEVVDDVIKFVGDSKSKTKCCGIEVYKSKREINLELSNKEREKNRGLTDKQVNYVLKQRNVERPPYQQLLKEIKKLGYVGTGKKYGVSDNAIRKWIKTYEKYDI